MHPGFRARSALTAKTRFLSRALACLVAAADGCPRSLSKQTHAWMLYFFTEPLPVSSDLSRPCAHSGRAGAHHGHADGKLRAIVRTPEVGAEERQGRSSNAHVPGSSIALLMLRGVPGSRRRLSRSRVGHPTAYTSVLLGRSKHLCNARASRNAGRSRCLVCEAGWTPRTSVSPMPR